ncbi:unnamed protein product [Linum tenue]|uniref:(S)-hydroxynitrile lyase n=1 Tax=Linum tenue TaxID=586396 RepID=A0AAV0R9K6_9ROSI|nr:unnamed protein product [Linum tenue]
MAGEAKKKTAHFVLVHGACHGAWTWFKLKPLLESAGHRVTAVDLAASGINCKAIQQVPTFRDYTDPLLHALSLVDEKVIVVGHSLGGMNCALAMEIFPEKIAAAVFLSAFMPDTLHSPSFVLDQVTGLDIQRVFQRGIFHFHCQATCFFNFLFFSLHSDSGFLRVSHKKDMELAKALARPSSLFLHDLGKAEKFTEEGYGSVSRVYVICNEDRGMEEEFQRWMIQNYVVEEVVEIKESDHMAMLCEPIKLFDCLSKVADNYSLDW